MNAPRQTLHSLRVYYADTDAGGVVYHAAYVCFFERARTEWLRARGFTPHHLAETQGILFAVKSLQLAYKKPAHLDDWLTIATAAAQAGRSRVLFTQELTRDNTLLTVAEVEIVCVSRDTFRPVAIPPQLAEHI